jgi:site-specific recombinase XerD
MSARKPAELGRAVRRFFEEYLPHLRGMSTHTIHSYRDALVLLLRFAASDTRRPIERLEIADLDAERVMRFLKHLESVRGNGIPTRNARLAAIHTFARFLAAERPEYLADLQSVLAIPFKRGGREAPIEYFESDEMATLLQSIDRAAPGGTRDYALFALLFNTGARVQEILNLQVRDVRLEAPHQVRLHGKGNKVRLCPIWPGTARLLRALISHELAKRDEQTDGDPAAALVFRNQRGGPLTRFGVRYRLRKHLAAAALRTHTLQDKRLHPHSLRHSTAIHLLKAGVDFATISQWLGHSSTQTTMRYARVDIDLKRAALAQVFPEALAPPRGGHLFIDGTDLTGWLRRL